MIDRVEEQLNAELSNLFMSIDKEMLKSWIELESEETIEDCISRDTAKRQIFFYRNRRN